MTAAVLAVATAINLTAAVHCRLAAAAGAGGPARRWLVWCWLACAFLAGWNAVLAYRAFAAQPAP